MPRCHISIAFVIIYTCYYCEGLRLDRFSSISNVMNKYMRNFNHIAASHIFVFVSIVSPFSPSSFLLTQTSFSHSITDAIHHNYYANAATIDNFETFDFNDVNRLKKGLKELNYLLSRWEEKTLYCNFGEFQQNLLAPENKEKLLVAAAETGLLDYDKSKTMIVKCKRDPQMVRAFLGLTPDNLNLKGVDKLMKKESTLALLVDPDSIDEYFEQVEKFSTALSSADSLSYQARSDYASTETVLKEDSKNANVGGKLSYLDQSKESVKQCQIALDRIVTLLGL